MTKRLHVDDSVKWMYDKVKWIHDSIKRMYYEVKWIHDGIKRMYYEVKWIHDGIKWMYNAHLESCVQVIATSAEKNPQQRQKNIPNIHDE